jgi:hypothetical protein
MRRIIDTTEVLGEVETPDGLFEVCAEAVALYDEEAGKLEVELDAFLRTTNIRVKEKKLSPDWLPKHVHVRESAAAEEAGDMARDIFHGWVRKVRESIPALKTHQM